MSLSKKAWLDQVDAWEKEALTETPKIPASPEDIAFVARLARERGSMKPKSHTCPLCDKTSPPIEFALHDCITDNWLTISRRT